MKRDDTLRAIQFAGYHGDTSAATRLLLECKRTVSYTAWQEAYKRGAQKKVNGVRCACAACLRASP